MVDAQSMEANQQKRRQMVWEIEKKLAEDIARASRPHRLLQTDPCEVPAGTRCAIADIARKKLVGQRVTLENQIRGLAVVFECSVCDCRVRSAPPSLAKLSERAT